MHMYMHMHMRIHAYIYIYIYTHIHTHTEKHTHKQKHMRLVCVCAYTLVCIRLHVRTSWLHQAKVRMSSSKASRCACNKVLEVEHGEAAPATETLVMLILCPECVECCLL